MKICENDVSEMAGKRMYFLSKSDAEVLLLTKPPFS